MKIQLKIFIGGKKYEMTTVFVNYLKDYIGIIAYLISYIWKKKPETNCNKKKLKIKIRMKYQN